jgi:hypothetical protein
MICDSEEENLPILAVMICPKPLVYCTDFLASVGSVEEDVDGGKDDEEEGVVLLDLRLRFRFLVLLIASPVGLELGLLLLFVLLGMLGVFSFWLLCLLFKLLLLLEAPS